MKAMTQQELQTFVDYFSELLVGAQLQDIVTSDRGMALSLHKGSTFWMILDLIPNTPMMLVYENQCPFKKSAKPKPVGLFLKSHGKNLFVESMSVQSHWGRVVELVFSNKQDRCVVQIRLIPKQCNVVVTSAGKSIAWEKPIELKEAPLVENPPEPRTLVALHEEWMAEQKNGVSKSTLDPVAQWEKQKQKDLDKKRKALGEIQKQIESDKEQFWYEAGEFLKAERSLVVPDHLRDFVDQRQTLNWNMENCFFKAKQFVAKKEGARERIISLEGEILKLEKTKFSSKVNAEKLPDLMRKAEAKGRKLTLESGAVVYCGKSAADNLSLLRQAKAWDYWFHLRDYPGAHAIIHRQRDQVISDQELQEVASWVAKESLSQKSLIIGQRVAVVYVECRFVRPIKGDKLGRVTYHSEKSLNLVLN